MKEDRKVYLKKTISYDINKHEPVYGIDVVFDEHTSIQLVEKNQSMIFNTEEERDKKYDELTEKYNQIFVKYELFNTVCPFCELQKRQSETIIETIVDNDFQMFRVGCEKINCIDTHTLKEYYPTKDIAIKVWKERKKDKLILQKLKSDNKQILSLLRKYETVLIQINKEIRAIFKGDLNELE